jgi:hypothetical protein
MEMSHVADDFAAIARRLKEIREETELAAERASLPVRRPNISDAPYWPHRPDAEGFRMQAR